jgi:hypothetical protein
LSVGLHFPIRRYGRCPSISLRQARVGGQRGMPVIDRSDPLDRQFSDEVRHRLPQSLTNGVHGSDWSMVFNF